MTTTTYEPGSDPTVHPTVLVVVALLAIAVARPAEARDIPVTPATLGAALSGLAPGDHVLLASGSYTHFTLSGVVGSAAAPIEISGPADGSAVVHADPGPCCNTVQIDGDVSYVVVRNLTIDGDGVDGAFGVDARGPNVHHVTIEGCTFLHHDGSQQHDAISTKTATSNWVIRGNRIMGAGTGMYLGNSTGDDPFVEGLIENNLFYDTIGYNTEIKWQLPHGAVPGASSGTAATVIRHNVFIKTDRASPDGDRPNLLVGGFPDTTSSYEIYGNVFVHNPRESLLQASGRVSIHDNVFFDTPNTAIRLQDHDLPLARAWVYDNTIDVAGTGIGFGNAAAESSVVVGNLVFAGTPIAGSSGDTHDNLTDTVASASTYLTMPGTTLGSVDFYPLPSRVRGAVIDLSAFATDVDHDIDFNCLPHAPYELRGAYAGEGTNPGWHLAMDVPPVNATCTMGPPPPTDGGVAMLDAGSHDAASSVDGPVTPADGSITAGAAGGCCSVGGAARFGAPSVFPLLLLLLGVASRRRW